MDLKEAWKTLEKEKLSVPVTGTITVPKHSKHPVANLILAFGLGLVFCVLFGMIFAGMLFLVDQTIVKVGLVIVVVAYTFLFMINLRVYRKIKKLYQSDEKVLSVLHSVHDIVTQTIQFQQKISWGFFPLCVAAGFVLGVSMKKDAAEMMLLPRFYLSLIVTMAIVTPACYFLTKWMTRISYGKYLRQIEDLIAQAEGD